MPVSLTRFRLAPHGRGVAALSLAFKAMSQVMPNAQIDALILDGYVFPIDTRCFPDTIWQRLMANPDWHIRLMGHLATHIAAATPERQRALQRRFIRHINRSYCKATVVGRVPFDSESSPCMWALMGIPRLRAMGCKLSIEDQTMHRGTGNLELLDLQRELYSKPNFEVSFA